MKQHGMLYKGEMVCRIQDDIAPKTQTRRPITFSNSITVPRVKRKEWHELRWAEATPYEVVLPVEPGPPYGQLSLPAWSVPFRNGRVDVIPRIQPGDVIWVRETFMDIEHRPVSGAGSEKYKGLKYWYKADNLGDMEVSGNWTPAIHMPRKASRIDLLVLGMRSERVQEISEVDAQAEGWTRRGDLSDNPQVHKEAAREWFMDLWDSINTDRGFPWSGNHPVWIHDFERVEG